MQRSAVCQARFTTLVAFSVHFSEHSCSHSARTHSLVTQESAFKRRSSCHGHVGADLDSLAPRAAFMSPCCVPQRTGWAQLRRCAPLTRAQRASCELRATCCQLLRRRHAKTQSRWRWALCEREKSVALARVHLTRASRKCGLCSWPVRAWLVRCVLHSHSVWWRRRAVPRRALQDRSAFQGETGLSVLVRWRGRQSPCLARSGPLQLMTRWRECAAHCMSAVRLQCATQRLALPARSGSPSCGPISALKIWGSSSRTSAMAVWGHSAREPRRSLGAPCSMPARSSAEVVGTRVWENSPEPIER